MAWLRRAFLTGFFVWTRELDFTSIDATCAFNGGFWIQEKKSCWIINWSGGVGGALVELSLTSVSRRREISWTNAEAQQLVGMKAAPWGQSILTREYKRFAAQISAVSLKRNVLTISTVTCQRPRAFARNRHSAMSAESLSPGRL